MLTLLADGDTLVECFRVVGGVEFGRACVRRSGAAILVLVAALMADRYLNYGFYTDAALNVLRSMGRSFGW
jgi:hypothetical protein